MSGKPDKKADKKPEAKPDKKPGTPGAAAPKTAKGKDQALPDAALVDENGDASTAAPARSGIAAWIPRSPRGWIIAGSGSFGLVVIIVASAIGLHHMLPPPPTVSGMVAGLAAAVDGATVNVAGRKLRLDGIEAPPADLVCRDGSWQYRCGDDARRALDAAIGRGAVDCFARPTDDAVCRNDQGMDIAALQVENGWAVVDLRQSSRYFAEQTRAQQDGRGLWRNDFARPETWRLAMRDSRKQSAGINPRP
jgi:endonuclease YncB( thermonuclease family)